MTANFFSATSELPPTGAGLNRRALRSAQQLIENSGPLGVQAHSLECGATIVDCGVNAPGSLRAGLLLAEACLAGLGAVSLIPGDANIWPGPWVSVAVDQPVAACLASQYAGWRIAHGDFFAMGSGPMRTLAGKEELFEKIGYRQHEDCAVGVLECGSLPSDEVCRRVAADCGVTPDRLTLLAARTASLAGAIQIAARSVETALHKMHELGFDVSLTVSGFGAAPLSPIAQNDLAGIGRTNDSILYGAEVALWLRCDNNLLQELGPKIPSSASRDYGKPFGELFREYGHDFYKVDPHLFSPAAITLGSIVGGKSMRFGSPRPDLLRRSFEG